MTPTVFFFPGPFDAFSTIAWALYPGTFKFLWIKLYWSSRIELEASGFLKYAMTSTRAGMVMAWIYSGVRGLMSRATLFSLQVCYISCLCSTPISSRRLSADERLMSIGVSAVWAVLSALRLLSWSKCISSISLDSLCSVCVAYSPGGTVCLKRFISSYP